MLEGLFHAWMPLVLPCLMVVFCFWMLRLMLGDSIALNVPPARTPLHLQLRFSSSACSGCAALTIITAFAFGVIMNAVTRWKTIATIAVAFSTGNLFATACQDAGGGKATAQESGDAEGDGGDDTTPPPEVSAEDLDALAESLGATQAEVERIKCVLRYLEDDDQDGEVGEGQNLRDYDVVAANAACGI